MKLKDLAAKFNTDLHQFYSVEEANSLFLLAIDHHLGLNRSAYLLKREEIVPPTILIQIEQLLLELINGKPIQYILGECYFYGLKLNVSPAVLIPRPETEELVEWILEKVSSLQLAVNNLQPLTPNAERFTILDIGTGSGCIAIALQKNLPTAKVYALDVAEDALAIAQQNAVLNAVKIDFIQQDILQSQNLKFPSQLNVMVSNPPYIKVDEKLAMHKNVLEHEPHLALFVPDENPLLFYTAIADFALKNLANDGLLFFEINECLGKETVELLSTKGFKNIELKKDMQGKNRMVYCQNQLRQLR